MTSAEHQRITVTLVPKAVESLAVLTAATGLSKTDVVNRAVQLYRFVQNAEDAGAQVLVRHEGGDTDVVRFL